MTRLSIVYLLILTLLSESIAIGSERFCKGRIAENNAKSLRGLLADEWWESAAGLYLCTLKPNRGYAHTLSLDPVETAKQLDQIKAQGLCGIITQTDRFFLDRDTPHRVYPARRCGAGTGFAEMTNTLIVLSIL